MKIICIGRNYEDHVSELQNERPDSPVIFIKPDSSIILNSENKVTRFRNNPKYDKD